MSEKITFIKLPGILVVGKLAGINDKKITLRHPRLVFSNKDEKTGQDMISLQRLIGNPEVAEFDSKADIIYESSDEEFDKFYISESIQIPGLSIVK